MLARELPATIISEKEPTLDGLSSTSIKLHCAELFCGDCGLYDVLCSACVGVSDCVGMDVSDCDVQMHDEVSDCDVQMHGEGLAVRIERGNKKTLLRGRQGK